MGTHKLQVLARYARDFRHTSYSITLTNGKTYYKYRNKKRSVFMSEKLHILVQRIKNGKSNNISK